MTENTKHKTNKQNKGTNASKLVLLSKENLLRNQTFVRAKFNGSIKLLKNLLILQGYSRIVLEDDRYHFIARPKPAKFHEFVFKRLLIRRAKSTWIILADIELLSELVQMIPGMRIIDDSILHKEASKIPILDQEDQLQEIYNQLKKLPPKKIVIIKDYIMRITANIMVNLESEYV